jgi:hypothetical protein
MTDLSGAGNSEPELRELREENARLKKELDVALAERDQATNDTGHAKRVARGEEAFAWLRLIGAEEEYVTLRECLSSHGRAAALKGGALSKDLDFARAEFQIEKAHHAETQRRLDAAYAANDSLKRSLDECGCTQVLAPGWANSRAMKAEAELFALRSAARKIHTWRSDGTMVVFDEAEQAAWNEATR